MKSTNEVLALMQQHVHASKFGGACIKHEQVQA
jgi:hypothetical protein